ncbi:glycosyltransferase [Massilia sp. IC2-278]|uniref:glycosyltransferase n=1 Tax=Massilia sp. IC2-278 TaxID=2887200 RepID=UPI001E3FC853|nr:glycosyltransferase [Massilia sp. IC2-278]MCC2962109.1 glycosyltransferase [Massilia sp. IC2-278]
MVTIVVFSHLRWDFVFQRPQHLLTRLACHYRIVIVEEPLHDGAGPARLERTEPCPNVTVCRPRTPLDLPGFHDDQIALVAPLLADLLPPGETPIAWFYTPMALPLLQELTPRLVVYDCMDELASFKKAPRQLLQRESALLNLADLVFAGGPSLYEAKRHRHPNVHCFPSSVDVDHFAQAQGAAASHPDQEHIPGPRLGFYGVIDERVDLALIGALADDHPDWQLVLVGPVVKITENELPRRPNIHYLGQRDYADLPRFLAGWDVCLMPFAINEATRFISPTKVLEYMAAELPIVSTPIADVVGPYGGVVAIAAGAQEFGVACAEALALEPAERAARTAAMREQVARTSWERTAQAMADLLDAAYTEASQAAEEALSTPVRRAGTA